MLERARVSKGQQSVWEAIHRGSYPELQEPSGRIATFWTSGGFKDPNGDWINCMAAIARALENLE